MRYWAVARCLGLSEDEFWRSTLAKVTALYRVRILTWDRTRDFFIAQNTAVHLNSKRQKETDHVFTPEELLCLRYPKFKKSVIITLKHDPDRGAGGDWKELKAGLKGTTRRAEAKKKRRVYHAGN